MNNDDLISREDLKEFINSTIASATKVGIVADADYLWELLNYAIDNAPTVEERPHGKWIFVEPWHLDGNMSIYKCSLCGRTNMASKKQIVNELYPFCNCGAEMKEDKNEKDTDII